VNPAYQPPPENQARECEHGLPSSLCQCYQDGSRAAENEPSRPVFLPIRRWFGAAGDLVKRYVRAVIPAKVAPRVHVRGRYDPLTRRRSVYWRSEPRDGMDWPKSDKGRGAISQGLAGTLEVAVAFGEQTSTWCVDLDAPGDVEKRASDVLGALGLTCGQVLVFRTPGGGLHLWGFLGRREASGAVRRALVGRLVAAGIEVRPGWVEVWPDGARQVRLPGTRGSDLYDPETGEMV